MSLNAFLIYMYHTIEKYPKKNISKKPRHKRMSERKTMTDKIISPMKRCFYLPYASLQKGN